MEPFGYFISCSLDDGARLTFLNSLLRPELFHRARLLALQLQIVNVAGNFGPHPTPKCVFSKGEQVLFCLHLGGEPFPRFSSENCQKSQMWQFSEVSVGVRVEWQSPERCPY